MQKAPKLTDAEKVTDYMAKLEHPLKAEINAVRKIIVEADPNIAERIKWNAPSYYYLEDLVTFNHRDQKRVHLVFHHPNIVNITSDLLEGDYKDRRMTYFPDLAAIKENALELQRIMKELVQMLQP